jgi:cytoplasmic iron level regulating protein YaaA (DUF328/UPF0246 family)
MKSLYLVSCVSKKSCDRSRAKDLYQSEWFKKARKFVERSGAPWYILSAKYGLLHPDELVAPYEQTLNKMPINERKLWATGVLDKLLPMLTTQQSVIVLAGVRYREFLMPDLTQVAGEVRVPMEGMRIGEQLAWLSKLNGQA